MAASKMMVLAVGLLMLATGLEAARVHIVDAPKTTVQDSMRARHASLTQRVMLADHANDTDASDAEETWGHTEQEIAALFDKWNAALQTLDPKQVAALYAEDAVLEPTVSNEVRYNRERIEDYFVTFLAKDPVGVINEQYIRILNAQSAINSGVYTFTLTDKASGNVSQVVARYTYLYELIDGEWLIAYHHSSAMPEPLLKSQIEWAFKKWADTVETGTPEMVADLYAPDAVLLPTLSNVPRTTRALIIDYFEDFMAKVPVAMINQGVVQGLGADVAMYAGVYTFTFKDGSAATARFSYTYRKVGADWLIIDHHSSAMPEQPLTDANTWW